ncbi:MAG: AEC family transporter [Desulfobulbaceae bacterium]|jgi:predicted permease|nr:AEC family transporter [Desulfobulbaceae bacterium]
MTNFLLIFFCLTVGIIMQRKRDLNPQAMSLGLNQYVIVVALPALILAKMPFLQFSTDLFIAILMPYIMLCFGAGMVLIGARMFKWSKEITGCLLLCVPMGNTSFLGIPMITAFFGEEFVQYGIVYDQLGSFIALATFGTIVLAKYQQSPHGTEGGDIFKKIITFPPFIGLMVSIPLRFLPYPAALATCFNHIGDSLVPVAMVAVGLQIKLRLPGRYILPFCHGLAVKLVLAPLLALALIKGVDLNNNAALIAVFEAGMPPMVTGGALAIGAGLAPKLAAALVGWGIILSFVTLTALSFLL